MELTQKQLEIMTKKEIVMLSTSNNNQPRTIFVGPVKIDKDKMFIADCEMYTTRNNILNNNKVFILGFDDEIKNWLKIEGIAKYYSKGNFFEEIKKEQESQGYTVKGIIEVEYTSIKEMIEKD